MALCDVIAPDSSTCNGTVQDEDSVLIERLRQLHDWYRMYHGYLAAVVCALGIVANGVNIIVLTRRSMLSAINCILTALAVSDGLTMVAYLPFALRFYVLYGVEPTLERNEHSAVRFLLFYAGFSVVVHTTSIWLTVVMATFRYIFVRFPRYGVVWCTLKRAKLSVMMVYIVSFVVCLPNFATIKMHSETFNESLSTSGVYDDIDHKEIDHGIDISPLFANVVSTEYTGRAAGVVHSSDHINESSWTSSSTPRTTPMTTTVASPSVVMWAVRFRRESDSEKAMFMFNFWVQAIFVRLVPCIILTLLSTLLVRTMRRAAAKRRSLGGMGSSGQTGRNPGAAWYRRWRQTNRTTRMLLVVVTLFLVTELPHSIAIIMSGMGERFVEDVYMNLGDVFDILALVNNGINFIIYCTMSRQFRKTFVAVFWPSRSDNGRMPMSNMASVPGGVCGGSGTAMKSGVRMVRTIV